MTQFKSGDRVFSHYTMSWGTIKSVKREGTDRNGREYTTWYDVRMDDNSRELLDDAHGDWNMARIVPPAIAQRYGYGRDPQAKR